MVKPDLQRRLEAAQEARRLAAQRAARPAPAPAPTDDEAPADDRAVIDLRTVRRVREATERAREAAVAAATPVPAELGPRSAFADTPLAPEPLRPWTAIPGSAVIAAAGDTADDVRTTTNPLQERCRACGGPLRLDMFDLVNSVAHLTCVDCGLLSTARSPHA